MRVKITELALEYLKFHTNENKGQEIYGWLLGYEEMQDNEQTVTIIASYSAHDYIKQTLIGAEPNPSEIASIENFLPIGIYNLGQYHSHPVNVYHSDTDDKTLLQMAKVYSDVISIVTNGEDTKLYKVDDGRVIEIQLEVIKKDIDIKFKEFQIKLELSENDKPNQAMKLEDFLSKLNFDGQKINAGKFTLGKNMKNKIKFKIPYVCDIDSKILSEQCKKYVTNIMYELVITFEQKIQSPKLIYYQNIPLNILDHSYIEKTAKERAELLKLFGRNYEYKLWKSI